MACEQERWCLNGVRATNGRQMLLLALFVFSVGSLAAAASDLYYNYDVLEGRSSINDRTSSIKLMEEYAGATRRRRATLDKAMMVTGEKDDNKQQLSQSQPQQQPSVSTSMPNSTTSNTSAVNEHYSTAYSNSPATTTTLKPRAVDTASSKPDQKMKNSTMVTPTPFNYNTSTVPLHVWANRTMWTNVTNATTSNAKESDNKNQTKVTELTPVKETTTTSGEEKSDTDVSDISISKFSDISNSTLKQNNITKTIYDTHQYYNSTFIIDADICKKYWVDMDNHPELRVNHLLSQSHRRAATVKLKFDFPFYGHKVQNITIATGGFLYTGEYVHSWLAATQYIAPLMANFDTRLSNDSYVKYADNGTAFTVEWEKVVLQDKPEAGEFTFQVTLHQNGDIVFVYSVIPLVVEKIEDTLHPVKVGLSDAYIMDRTVFFVRRKTIYEYHRVNFNRQDIKNCTVIYLRALPTCLGIDNCRDCMTKVPYFDCKWCPGLNQCSTGTFRLRQDWLVKGCDAHNIKEANKCPPQITTYKGEEYDHDGRIHPGESTAKEMSVKQERPGSSPLESTRENMNMSVSGIIGILTVIGLVMGLAGWGAYAYRNPHSASGQILIRYRPSQWSWRRGEARYTAATIHM